MVYIGVNDHDIDLFEGQYVVPNGMAYNSYLLLDSSKFGSKGLMRVCETSRFEAVICDRYTGPAENRPANLLSVEEESQQS